MTSLARPVSSSRGRPNARVGNRPDPIDPPPPLQILDWSNVTPTELAQAHGYTDSLSIERTARLMQMDKARIKAEEEKKKLRN